MHHESSQSFWISSGLVLLHKPPLQTDSSVLPAVHVTCVLQGGTGGGADQMLSPNHIFAAEYGHAFGSQQPSSSSLATGFGSQAGDWSASFQSMVHPAVVAGSNTEGSLVGGSGLTVSSFSKGGSYTIAESSYSPTHCRPGGDPVEIWQRYGHQQELLSDSSAPPQQQQQVLPARLSGLCGEPSLRPPPGWCSATVDALLADAAAPAAPATADVSGITLQQQPAPAGLQPQGSDFSLQPLQPPRRQQQAQGGQGAQPGAEQALQAGQRLRQDANVQSLDHKTLDSRKVGPPTGVQERHDGHTSAGARTERHDSHTSAGPRTELVPAGSGDSLQLRQGSAESAGKPRPNPSPAALQAKQLADAATDSEAPGYTPDEYKELMVRARASPTKPTVMAAATQPGPAEAAALWQGPAVLQPASLPRPSRQQDEQQHATLQVSASPQRQVPGAGQQQQSTAAQQHAPRPSPLGPSKAPTQLVGRMERQAGSGNGSVYVSGPGAAASGPQGNLAAEQQVLSGGGGWVPAVSRVAAEARRVLAGAVGAERPQQSTSPRAGSPRSALQQATVAAAGASPQQQQQQQGGYVNRTAALAQSGGPLAAADAGPGSSNCSSGNTSPRLASAPSGLQRVSVNAMSLYSCTGTSGQGSPCGSLPTTPRSMQRASLGADSFVSAGSAAPGSPSGRASSSSSMGASGAQQAWAGAGVGCQAAAEAADSDDFDEDAMFCGPGVSSACRARTPSGSMLGPKEALGAIPELPAAFESRTSDPSDPSNPTSTDRP